MVVIAVGKNSQAGRINVLVQNASDEGDEMTVLSNKLHVMSLQIGKLGLFVALLCFFVMLTKFCINTYAIADADTICYEKTWAWPTAADPMPDCQQWAMRNGEQRWCGQHPSQAVSHPTCTQVAGCNLNTIV